MPAFTALGFYPVAPGSNEYVIGRPFLDQAAWYRILRRENLKYSNEKSPAGKVDYHTMGACYDILPALARRRGAN